MRTKSRNHRRDELIVALVRVYADVGRALSHRLVAGACATVLRRPVSTTVVRHVLCESGLNFNKAGGRRGIESRLSAKEIDRVLRSVERGETTIKGAAMDLGCTRSGVRYRLRMRGMAV